MASIYHQTDFGVFKISASEKGITELRLVEEAPASQLPTSGLHLDQAVRELDAYFAGELQVFTLPLDWSGATEFHRSVWKQLMAIGYGRTVSYQFIADRLGDPKACQAVGQANRRNPIAIVVPCHRVIAKTGDLQGYFYGLDFKRRLLGLENPASFGVQGSLF